MDACHRICICSWERWLMSQWHWKTNSPKYWKHTIGRKQ